METTTIDSVADVPRDDEDPVRCEADCTLWIMASGDRGRWEPVNRPAVFSPENHCKAAAVGIPEPEGKVSVP